MNTRDCRSILSLLVLLLLVSAPAFADDDPRPATAPPNFVIVFADDLGYGDLGCYGSANIRTPNLDRMADEGMRFTSFYAQTVCGPSRSALMTGCYPIRVARRNNNHKPVHPEMHAQEITIAELLRTKGYATACLGKWDLAGHSQVGFVKELMPNHQGFDYYFGTPSSNDSIVNLYRNEQLVQEKADMAQLTRQYTDEAIGFIRQSKDKPFFVYLAHTMPHTRLAVSDAFKGRSRRGQYGDVVEEMDHHVGRLIETIRELGLQDNTYVFFISDNGPWHRQRFRGGSAGPLRSAKTSTWEGGVRVPAIAWAPGRIAPGQTQMGIATTMDMLPTLCALAGVQPPQDRVIDGQDITAVLAGQAPDHDAPEREFYYYQHRQLRAVRSGPWKLHLPYSGKIEPGQPDWDWQIDPADTIAIPSPMLINLEEDISERFDVAKNHPEIVERLMALAEKAKRELGHLDRQGSGARVFD